MACSSIEELRKVVETATEGIAIILGYVPEMLEVERFHLWSTAQIKEGLHIVGELNEEDQKMNSSAFVIRKYSEIYLPRKKVYLTLIMSYVSIEMLMKMPRHY